MRFRPLPGLTLASIPVLALLIALGVWQAQRAQWKADLIAQYEAAGAAPPRPLTAALCAGEQGRVAVDLILGTEELRIYGGGPRGEPGWLIVQLAFAPQCMPGAAGEAGPRALVQTGFETLDGARAASPRVLHLEPWPEAGAFTPRNDPQAGQYYRFDAADLGGAFGVPPDRLSPLWARWDERTPLERATIAPATHIGYALTWFGLAAALLAVYLAMHVRAGRLRLRDG